MATTTNYGWTTPDNSGLVKNGASDIRTLGTSVDTSLWNVGYGQAGKNKIINGDFTINQRAFTSTSTDNLFNFDRWLAVISVDPGTVSAQTFTPGTAPVAGYESTNFFRFVTSSQVSNTSRQYQLQRIEDVRTFAGQTVTLSFWAKAASGTPKIGSFWRQNFGSGGSANVNNSLGAVTISTSWARYSLTYSVPSITGKTIGAGSHNAVYLVFSEGSTITPLTGTGLQNATFDIWGVQVEYGSFATPFQTATGTIQGELAACQRYYYRVGGDQTYAFYGSGFAKTTTQVDGFIQFPIPLRTTPTSMDYANLAFMNYAESFYGYTSVTMNPNGATKLGVGIYGTVSGVTAGHVGNITAFNSLSSYLGFSAEL